MRTSRHRLAVLLLQNRVESEQFYGVGFSETLGHEKIGYSLGDAAANFVFMTMILFQANFYTDVMGIAAGNRRLSSLLVAAAVGRVLRSGHGRAGRPHADAVGPLSPVDSVHGAALGHRHVPGLHDAVGLEPHGDHRLCVRHEHAADDALLGEQHAVRGAGRRDDRRFVRADAA